MEMSQNLSKTSSPEGQLNSEMLYLERDPDKAIPRPTISARRSSAKIQSPIMKVHDGKIMLFYLPPIIHDGQLRNLNAQIASISSFVRSTF
ncbi:hypothetical protein GALMADRAFT_583945 [Galerina marginata CBS 339.88]|uniref:Uncharacterized protein n=1 Tax=Galerina marginata (strain CBS 339.88) TaxID=685588 RepID=A0A067SWK3_GALM3|nr:hypothetical protein GALMADRAFT_583945 [Galerina marginata CBS 339.88]